MALFLGVSSDTEFESILYAWEVFFEHILSIVIIRIPAEVNGNDGAKRFDFTHKVFGCGAIVVNFLSEQSRSSFSNAFNFSLIDAKSSFGVEQNNIIEEPFIILKLRRFEMNQGQEPSNLYESIQSGDNSISIVDNCLIELPICACCLRRIKGNFSGLNGVDSHPIVCRQVKYSPYLGIFSDKIFMLWGYVFDECVSASSILNFLFPPILL
jgi:hypothetical protein